jgi:NADPH:quinone reductase-like Zn-dependent oxidoreductase
LTNIPFSDFKKGDRVYYTGALKNKFGAFAEYGVVEAIAVTHLPDEVSFVQGKFLHWRLYWRSLDKVICIVR